MRSDVPLEHTATRPNRLFASQALRYPGAVGAVVPSSRPLAKQLTAPAAAACGPLRVLEVGAGTGPATRELLAVLPPDSTLDVVESNTAFVAVVRDILRKAPRISAQAHAVRIEDFDAEQRYDGIVSGLPMTNFSPDSVRTITARYFDLLAPGGWLTYFAYLGTRHLRRLTAGSSEIARHHAVEDILGGYRAHFEIGRRRVWANLPPAAVYELRKPVNPTPAQTSAFSRLPACDVDIERGSTEGHVRVRQS